jgi:arsenical pump membrane protein
MRGPRPLDWVGLAAFAAGTLCAATGALPLAEAHATIRRIVPILLFLGSVVILAELAARAQVFDVIATGMAILGRGRYSVLFGLCVLFASATTVVLNLDTTAVLLTPIMLALAARADIAAVPLAMTTVWLANTASLLLPVSNLTNLLAADRIGLAPLAFAHRMWAAQLASILVTMAALWWFYWRAGRRGVDRYQPPRTLAPRDRILCVAAGVACLLFVVTLLLGLTLWIASAAAAGLAVLAFASREPTALRLSLIPWRLLAFVIGLFLLVQTISAHGLDVVVRGLVGAGGGWLGALRAAGTGAGLANLVNNLPAYLAGEPAVSGGHHLRLLALLIGVNVASIITPWASLANLLWQERCAAAGVRIPLRVRVRTGLALVAVVVPATVLALLATGG